MGTIARYYSNNAVPGAVGNPSGLGPSDTSLYLTETPAGYPQQYPFTLRLSAGTSAEEAVSVTAGVGTQANPWTIERGFDNTAQQSHAPGIANSVAHGMTQIDLALARQHEAQDSSSASLPHGLPLSAWQAGTMAIIGETTLPDSTSSVVNFGSIPQTYTHLLVIMVGRLTSTSVQYGYAQCAVNADTAAVYSRLGQVLGTTGGSLAGPTAENGSSETAWNRFMVLAASQSGTAVNIGGGWAFLSSYSSTTFNKQFTSLSGFGNGTDSGAHAATQWGWYNPSAQAGISSLSFQASAGNFAAGTFVGVYGLA